MEEPPAKKVRVHFGSLEEQEKKRLAEEAVTKSEESDATNKIISAAVRAGIEAGNINIDIAEGEKCCSNVVETSYSNYSPCTHFTFIFIRSREKFLLHVGLNSGPPTLFVDYLNH